MLLLLLLSILPMYHQEGGSIEGSGLSLCPGSRTPKVGLEPVLLKHTCQTSRANTLAQYGALEGSGRRLAMARAGLSDSPHPPPPRWQPLGWPGLAWGGAASQMLAPSCFSLGLSSESGAWPLPSPRSRWPLQPGTGPRRAAASKVQNRGSPCVSSGSSHKACLLPEGLAWAHPGGGPQRGARALLPEPLPPTLTHQVSHGRARTSILRFVCWSLPGGGGEGRWLRG